MPFNFKRLAIPEVILIEPNIFTDKRGLFVETYKYSAFKEAGIKEYFIQSSYSRSIKNVLRGLHYQKVPKEQAKLVRCIKGEVFDVAVDIRQESPTYGQWVSATLTKENNMILYIPHGFAHGFFVLSKIADVVYEFTEEYSPGNARGIIWNDPDIGILWPAKNPILSEKDLRNPALKEADNNFNY